MTQTIAKINIYQHAGEWCYAAFGPDGLDHSDTIGCADDASEAVARTEVAGMFPAATIERIEGVS